MARALSTPPNGNTANTRPHRLIIRHEYKGRHLCVVHEYGGERLEGAALEPSLKAMEASIGRLIETSHSRETGTLRQATPEQEGQSTDAKRKERNQKRRERRKNLRAKKLEERNDAENEGTQSQAPQSERASPESSDTKLRANELEERKGAENEETQSQAPQSEGASPTSSETNITSQKDTSKVCSVWQDLSKGSSRETSERTRVSEPSEGQRRRKKKKKRSRTVPPNRGGESGRQQQLSPSPKEMDNSNPPCSSSSPAESLEPETRCTRCRAVLHVARVAGVDICTACGCAVTMEQINAWRQKVPKNGLTAAQVQPINEALEVKIELPQVQISPADHEAIERSIAEAADRAITTQEEKVQRVLMDKNYVLVTMKTKEQRIQFIKKYSGLIMVKGAAHTWFGRARLTGTLRAPPSPEQAAQEQQDLQEKLRELGCLSPEGKLREYGYCLSDEEEYW